MGASVSSNVIKVVTKAIANISSSIIQKTRLSQDTSQLISVSDIDGDVWIVGNVFYQRATVNMKVLMKAIATEEARQQIVYEISQEAKSLISGLNIGQFSDASNTLDILMEATINMTSVISQTCLAIISANQSIVVKRVKGNLYIQNNVFSQVSDIIFSCVQAAVSDNKAIQDLEAKLDQHASAKAEGLSAWVLVALLAVVIGVPTAGVVFGGATVLKYIFPLLIIFGIALIVVYYVWSTTDMKLMGYSTLIGKNPVCLGQTYGQPTGQYSDPAYANDVCLKDNRCVAFDWKGVNVDEQRRFTLNYGQSSLQIPPITTFYNSIDSKCYDSVKHDDVDTLRTPDLSSGPVDPPSDPIKFKEGDAYVNVSTTQWFQKHRERWEPREVIIKEPFGVLYVDTVRPTSKTPGKDTDFYLFYDTHNPISFYLYQYKAPSGWMESRKITGPGIVPNAPKVTNTSGFKVQNRKVWLLYLGITAIVIGSAGSAYTYTRTDKKVK